jgi:tripartite-type tricarboxylate transporter receptor subunit TctC
MLATRLIPTVLLFGLLSLNFGLAFGQNYPNRPVRLIVPLAVGGGMDTIARGVAPKLSETLGKAIIVDNRPGAGGSVGAEITAHAVPDGYTIMMASASLVTNVLLYPARYDPGKDFAAISQVSAQPYVLISIPSIPATTVSELIAYAKANPGRLNYASSGNGGLIHLTTELFQSLTGTRLVHIPFGGMGAAYPDILSGRIQVAFPSTISAMPHIKSGRLRALGMTSRVRSKALPDVPPLNEAGVPGFDVTQWYGLLAPAATPRAIIDRLQRETVTLLRLPDVVSRMASDGSEPIGSTSAQFTAHIRSEIQKWTKVVKDAGIRGE